MSTRRPVVDPLRSLIDEALPKRYESNYREQLIALIAMYVQRWKAIQPEIAPQAARIKKLTQIGDKLKKSIEEIGAALKRLDVDADLARIRAENAALGIDPSRGGLAGRSAAVDLYLVAWQAVDGLRRWDRLYRAPKGRPPEFAPQLVATIEKDCKRNGLSEKEIEDLLSQLSETDGLPKLNLAAVKQRRRRTKGRQKQ